MVEVPCSNTLALAEYKLGLELHKRVGNKQEYKLVLEHTLDQH